MFIYGYTKEIEIANALNFCTIDWYFVGLQLYQTPVCFICDGTAYNWFFFALSDNLLTAIQSLTFESSIVSWLL